MSQAIKNLNGKVPQGVIDAVVLLIKTVKRDAFAVAEHENDEGGTDYLFCSFEPDLKGGPVKVRTICVLIPLDAVTLERPIDSKSPDGSFSVAPIKTH